MFYLQEHLSLVRNNLRDIHDDVTQLGNLRVLNARHNKLKNSGVPGGVFHLGDLTVVVRIVSKSILCQTVKCVSPLTAIKQLIKISINKFYGFQTFSIQTC